MPAVAAGTDIWGNRYYYTGSDLFTMTQVTSATSGETWQLWNETRFNGGTGAAVSFAVPPSYTTGGTIITGAQTAGSIIWSGWNNTTAYEETAEQQAARLALEAARAAEWEEQQARQQATRIAANDRATGLLLELLTDEQARSYTEQGYFEVRGSHGGRWRIRDRGQQGNVELLAEIGELVEARFCCHPPGGLPNADAHIAQMLAIVTDEPDFIRTANRLRAA